MKKLVPNESIKRIKTLVHRARSISDPSKLGLELEHLTSALLMNGYSEHEIRRAVRPSTRGVPRLTENVSDDSGLRKAFLPYIENTTDRIAKLLRAKGIKTVFRPTTKLQQLFAPVKDKLDPLLTSGVYAIPCECGTEYVGMTDRSVKTRIKEHSRYLRLNQPDKSAVAEHSLGSGHIINFSNTKVLAKTNGFYNLARREAIEIAQHPNNLNRDRGLGINPHWKPVLRNKQTPNYTRNGPPPPAQR